VRLALPTRIPLSRAFAFFTLLFIVQQLQRTDLIFGLLFYGFGILTVLAFNFAEGFTRLTGAYIFWYSMLIVIFGVFWKAVVGEPADSNLLVPRLDMALYTCSMVMLLAVTLLNKKMDFRSSGMGAGFSGEKLDLTVAGLGCVVASILINILGDTFGSAPGSVVSALVQINVFFQLGIILATAGAVRDSGGRRSLNYANLLGLFFYSIQGLESFGKQGMLTPYLCWVVGAFYMRMRVRLIHIIFAGFMVVLTLEFIGPISVARDLVPENASNMERLEVIGYQLAHWSQFKEHVAQITAGSGHESGAATYYDKPQSPFIERLSMIPPDDTFNNYSAKGNFEGIRPVIEWFENMLPRFLNAGKSNEFTGNHFAHEIGGYLSPDDFTTGISFSPVSTAYHCMGWGGIFWVMPGIWILLFTSADFVSGDLRKYPWSLMVIVWFAHQAPESLLQGMIYYISYGNLGMFLAIIISTRIAPILGSVFIGKEVPVATRAVGRTRITPQPRPQE
jgi:hypothetical protein